MKFRPWTLAFWAVLWLSTLGVGEWLLSAYTTTPGALGDQPVTWPASSPITKEPGRWVLVLFAHPHFAVIGGLDVPAATEGKTVTAEPLPIMG